MASSLTPSAARLRSLAKASCQIFSTTFNPTASRNGNKILRQRLRGPALLNYYPEEKITLQRVIRAFPELHLIDEAEQIRLADVDARKRSKFHKDRRSEGILTLFRRKRTSSKRPRSTGDEGQEALIDPARKSRNRTSGQALHGAHHHITD